MGKLLSTKDKLLLGLAVVGDIYNELNTMGGIITSGYEIAYGFVPKKYRKANFYMNVSRMIKTKNIEKVIKNGSVSFRITGVGRSVLNRDFPLLPFQAKKWDKKWRIVTFDIPEKKRTKRDLFRRKLKELGFGMIQESLWVTPHAFEDDISEFIKTNNLIDYSYVFVSEKLMVGNIETLVKKIWALDKINKLYEQYCDKKENNIYFEALTKDPFLPKELLPEGWLSDKAKSIFKTSQNK